MVVLYWLWQLSWGILQTLIGFILFLFNLNRRHFLYRGAVITEWKRGGGISLGLFVFVAPMSYNGEEYDERSAELLTHEYGHTIQSLILGPLYLLVIGIPSFLWASIPYFKKRRRKLKISYYSLYTEYWANLLARRVIGTTVLDKLINYK